MDNDNKLFIKSERSDIIREDKTRGAQGLRKVSSKRSCSPNPIYNKRTKGSTCARESMVSHFSDGPRLNNSRQSSTETSTLTLSSGSIISTAKVPADDSTNSLSSVIETLTCSLPPTALGTKTKITSVSQNSSSVSSDTVATATTTTATLQNATNAIKLLIKLPELRDAHVDYVPDEHRTLKFQMYLKNEALKYSTNNLTEEQFEIFKYVQEHANDIILIQAGPGTGKTFTLQSVSYHLDKMKYVIIYKRDLLTVFRNTANTYTNTKLLMGLFDLSYFKYKQFDMQITGRMTKIEYVVCFVNLLRIASSNMLSAKNAIVILDEYSILTKPCFAIFLILLEYHGVSTIICGDKNQLQTIHDSKHSICSSYDIGKMFAKKIFTLNANIRCPNIKYNNLIDFISNFSSDKKLCTFAFALISAIFPRQMLTLSQYHNTHLAAQHRELTEAIHSLVLNNNYAYEFYLIDGYSVQYDKREGMVSDNHGMYYPSITKKFLENNPVKFLPYLPLVLEATYYYEKHSELSLCVLKAIDLAKKNLTIRECSTGKLLKITKISTNDVLFEEHAAYLLAETGGKLFNYPIYPANFMSLHKCQGCTISQNVELILNNTTYRGLYVGLSRVKSPNQIQSIRIPDPVKYLTSAIINFPDLVKGDSLIDVETLKNRLENYKLYDIGDLRSFSELNFRFFSETDENSRSLLRQTIINKALKYPNKLVMPPWKLQSVFCADDKNNNENEHLITLSSLLRHREIILAISHIHNQTDRFVLLHELMLYAPEIFGMNCMDVFPFVKKSRLYFKNETAKKQSNPSPTFINRPSNTLTSMVNINEAYALEVPSCQYIEQTAIVNSIDENREQFVIVHESATVVKETTKFCYKIYHKYKNMKVISAEWLLENLKYILKNQKNPQHIKIKESTKSQENVVSRAERLKLAEENRKSIRDNMLSMLKKM